MMKILHIFPYSPIPPTFGGALRVYNLIKQMSKYNQVTLLTFGDENIKQVLKNNFSNTVNEIHTCYIPKYRRKKRLVQLYSLLRNQSSFSLIVYHKQMQRIIDKLTSDNKYDIVQFEFPHMANYRINSDAIKILDAHNVEHLIYYHQWQYTNSKLRKFFYKREYKKLFHDEISACKNQDALLVTSQNDASTFDKFIPEIPKYLIPNGVDTEYFHPTEENHEQYSLVFTGALSYIPNSDGAIYFIEQILPHIQKIYPDIKIYIVGKNPPNNLLEKSSKNVIITGYVEDVRPYVWKSAIFVVPLRMGSGTRLKILEALAMKKPVVTTSVGAEGLDVINGETVLIADDPKDFAEKVINLIKDNQLQQKLVSNGYELAKNVYDWIVIGEKLNEVYKTIYSFHKNSREKKTNHKK